MSKRMNECMHNEWVNEQWVNEWMCKWMNELMTDLISVDQQCTTETESTDAVILGEFHCWHFPTLRIID